MPRTADRPTPYAMGLQMCLPLHLLARCARFGPFLCLPLHLLARCAHLKPVEASLGVSSLIWFHSLLLPAAQSVFPACPRDEKTTLFFHLEAPFPYKTTQVVPRNERILPFFHFGAGGVRKKYQPAGNQQVGMKESCPEVLLSYSYSVMGFRPPKSSDELVRSQIWPGVL
jgi:hypothetical protein